MIEVVCDNTELQAIWDTNTPDVVVIGGYAVDASKTSDLINQVHAKKKEIIGDEHVPVKWNVRDLDRALKIHDLKSLSSKLKENSELIRSELIRVLIDSGATFFISLILAHSAKKEKIVKRKADLAGYAFSNLLMRVGLYCKSKNGDCSGVLVLDWPDGNHRDPFISEYLSGWKHGKSGAGGSAVKYYCGPLKSLGFRASPLFGVTDLDERLQLADLIVGASRTFINYSMEKIPESDFGVREFRKLIPRFYIGSRGIVGGGISIAPKDNIFADIIRKGLRAIS